MTFLEQLEKEREAGRAEERVNTEREKARADAEKSRADVEKSRADIAESRADELAKEIRELNKKITGCGEFSGTETAAGTEAAALETTAETVLMIRA